MADVMKEDDEVLDSAPANNEDKVEIELTEDEAKRYEEPAPTEDRVAKKDDEDEEDREAIRERRRQEKRERKDRRDKAINRDKIELSFLRKQNETLERRIAGLETRGQQMDLGIIEQRLQAAKNEAAMADRVIAKAVSAGNGDDVATAMQHRDRALAEINRLSSVKQQAAQKKAPADDQNNIDRRALDHAKEFMEDHDWYDPAGGDESSAIVLALDNALHREGLDPTSEDYWDELRDRVKRRLPEKFEKTERRREVDDEAPRNRVPRGGPNVASGREHAPSSTRREVYISPDRKQALIEAGVWDDPVLRQRYIKKYMEYDRSNRDR